MAGKNETKLFFLVSVPVSFAYAVQKDGGDERNTELPVQEDFCRDTDRISGLIFVDRYSISLPEDVSHMPEKIYRIDRKGIASASEQHHGGQGSRIVIYGCLHGILMILKVLHRHSFLRSSCHVV